ncbi:pLS20_p028 family conjugation system transmembrane protein, partial [Streptococcus uberis]
MEFNTYSDVVKSIPKDFWDLNGATNGNITGDGAKKFSEFYLYWGNYLEPTPAFLAYLMQLVGGIVKALYLICVSLEHVFNNMFKAFGLFGYLGDQTTLFGKLFFGFQVLGTTLFTLILVVSAITGVFSKPVKYKHVITNFLLVTLVTAVLPLALTTISQTVAQDAQSIQTMSIGDSKESYSSLAIQPMKNNVVDIKILAENDFNKDLFPMDNFGFIKPLKEGSTAVNNITDDTKKRDTSNFATKIDFSAMYGVSNEKLLDTWEKKYKGIKGLFLHKINASQDGVETIVTHKVVGGLNAFEPVYLRYKVNWIGMIAQYLILISLLIVMSIKFVKSVFDIFIESLISPIQGYSSLNTKKYKELLRTIGGGFAGIFFEIVIMRITLEICRDLPTLSVTGISKLSGGFFDGLNMWEQCIAACVVYIALFLSAM